MFELPKLPYDYDALSGVISCELMKLHHTKHHQAYVDKLNIAIQGEPDLVNRSIDDILLNINDVKLDKRQSIINFGGGHYNHSLFWRCMSPNGGGEPSGELLDLITIRYGSFQEFVNLFTSASVSLFGSGWVWLQPNGDIITTPNQDTPISQGLDSPLLCLDVWEHAYYLDYQNRRDDYIKAWWGVVDWAFASSRYYDFLSKGSE